MSVRTLVLPVSRLILFIIGLLTGCSGPNENLPETAPVSGSVTYQGHLVREGMVTFFPVDGRRPSSGPIGKDGHYRLSTFERGDGALLGRHKVIVEASRYDEAGNLVYSPQGDPQYLLPTKYIDKNRTPLEFEVSRGDNVYDIVIDE